MSKTLSLILLLAKFCLFIRCCSLHALFWFGFLFRTNAGGFVTYSLALSSATLMLFLLVLHMRALIRYSLSFIAYMLMLRTSLMPSSHWLPFLCVFVFSYIATALFCSRIYLQVFPGYKASNLWPAHRRGIGQ